MSSPESWDELLAGFDRRDVEAVISVLERTPRSQRRDWPKRLRRLRREHDRTSGPAHFWYTELIGTAEFVCADDPRAAARLVHQQALHQSSRYATRLFAAMDVEWLPELLDRLATYDDRHEGWEVTDALRRYLGAPYPARDGYLTVLIRRLYYPDMVRQRLHDDPELVDLVPRILEIPDIGVHLSRRKDPEGSPRPGSPNDTGDSVERVVVELVDAGRLDRAVVLERTCRALVSRGKPAHIAFFVRLHDKLQPTPAELAGGADAYIELLSFGSGSAAGAGLHSLVSLWEDGLLPSQVPLDLTPVVLTRPEKTLVTAHLRWLAQIAASSPELRPVIIEAAQTGLDHDRADVRDAVQSLLSQCGQTAPAKTALPRSADQPPPSYQPQPAAPPLADLGELVEAVTRSFDEADVLLIERIADGISRLGADRDALSAAFAPLEPRLRWYHEDPQNDDRGPFTLDRWHSRPQLALLADCLRGTARTWAPRHGCGSAIALAARLQEVAVAVTSGRIGPLLALPTSANGEIDPETLLGRIRELRSAGLDAGPRDIEQAWLRLPVVDWSGLLEAAREFGSPTGHALADLVAAGPLPAPSSAITWRSYADSDTGRVDRRPTVTVTRSNAAHRPVATQICQQPTGWVHYWASDHGPPLGALWLLPQHREVAAAELLPALANTNDSMQSPLLKIVSNLPHGRGAMGLCGHTLLALAAGNADRRMRSVGAECLTALADQGAITASEFASACQDVFSHDAPPKRLADVLAELSQQTPTIRRFIVQSIVDWLPDLLGSTWREAPRLLMIAADAAEGLGLKVTSSDLDAVADDTAAKRLNVEARRLRAALAG